MKNNNNHWNSIPGKSLFGAALSSLIVDALLISSYIGSRSGNSLFCSLTTVRNGGGKQSLSNADLAPGHSATTH